MGLARIILEMDFRRVAVICGEKSRQYAAICTERWNHYQGELRDWRRGWCEDDIISLASKIADPAYYSGGVVKITIAEHKAWPEMNRRIRVISPKAVRSPVVAWAEGKGLFQMIRLL